MNMIGLRSILLASVAGVFLSACAGQDQRPDLDSDTVGLEDDTNGSESTGFGSSGGLSEQQLEEQARQQEQDALTAEQDALRDVRVFYFEFDKALVEPAAQVPLRAHATYLSNNPNTSVVLNGYTDERGTKEYNLALGERRAKAIERFLLVNGAADTQVETVSFGEEFPANYGSSDDAYSKNRRVVLEYR
ncbi:OmpA family protein [Allohahella marinimesophila]|uniref:Peptidoglycan-associated lipoprotein n=1 Tax=Allohahella marinimesophila TaxID=1054972 RepID=A0ABP7NNY3_9GAMM